MKKFNITEQAAKRIKTLLKTEKGVRIEKKLNLSELF